MASGTEEEVVEVDSGLDLPSGPHPELSRRLLVITQDAQVSKALRSILDQSRVPMSILPDELVGWRGLLRLKPKVAIIDLGSRSASGFALCEQIRARAELQGMFLLLLDDGGQADEPCTMDALHGPDAVVSGPHAHELLASIAAGVLESID